MGAAKSQALPRKYRPQNWASDRPPTNHVNASPSLGEMNISLVPFVAESALRRQQLESLAALVMLLPFCARRTRRRVARLVQRGGNRVAELQRYGAVQRS